ncbi:MAG: hypothetical protein Q9181_008128 [Wetmoreana brouardii]
MFSSLFVLCALAATVAAVAPPPKFNGAQSGIGSWFQTNAASSSTNGHSWCGYPYSDDQPLFAPSLALMGGATSGSAWDQQRREYCGREAKVTNPATGASKLLYIGDSFAQPRSDGAIDIVIGAFIDLYGSDPNGNHNLVMNPVTWQLTGNVNNAYTADGATFANGDLGNTTAGNDTERENTPSTRTGCTWGCLGWDCSNSVPCQDPLTCRRGYCRA